MKMAVNFCPVILMSFFFSAFLSCSSISSGVTNLIISDEDEVELGNKFKTEILAKRDSFPVHRDQVIKNYVDSIGQVIASSQQDRRTIDYTFTVIDKDVINAFAIPGGHVFVYAGLIRACRNEAELAGVIAHEVGHITKRHSMQKMVQLYGAQFLLDILLGDEGKLTQVVAGLTTNLLLLDYGRANEFEADSLSVEYSILAGYNPRGIETFLTLLDEQSEDGGFFQFLSTHPETGKRVKRVKGLVEKKGENLSEELFYEANFSGYRGRL